MIPEQDMVKTPHKHLIFFIGIIVILVFVGNILLGSFLSSKKTEREAVPTTATPTAADNSSDYFSYQGEAGKDALTLLKEKATVEQDTAGLVTSINRRKADSEKREYWGFYVNGELAPVGAADYETKEDDRIDWKIETY